MARRYYSSTAIATTLAGNVNNSTTSVTVTNLTGFPSLTPWTAVIDADTATEELVEVTGVSGTTLTVTRGVDGTSPTAHNAGAVFRHNVSARDFDEPNAHINDASGDVHSQYLRKTFTNVKGDLLAGNASGTFGKVALGTDTHVLTADSSQTLGVKWAAHPAQDAAVAAAASAAEAAGYLGAMQVLASQYYV